MATASANMRQVLPYPAVDAYTGQVRKDLIYLC